ncbi:hypothetical protein BRETT_005178 [Brettanomyces bruxellensis]|uniref:Uncharacterized protein n=1 Tax=Dekkera bruxellensis TaxID=5007 RepID=A0A871R3B5_DEKBR|nr:uncharacterized protein BRETT_005178 [Brettanomyces bruxellensis]QOU18118.1 hypothetical protein BRETT_005178 [Brettanomyces bruxellensis]
MKKGEEKEEEENTGKQNVGSSLDEQDRVFGAQILGVDVGKSRKESKLKKQEELAEYPKDMLDFDEEGYDDEGYDMEGYNRQGYDRSGFRRGEERRLRMRIKTGKDVHIVPGEVDGGEVKEDSDGIKLVGNGNGIRMTQDRSSNIRMNAQNSDSSNNIRMTQNGNDRSDENDIRSNVQNRMNNDIRSNAQNRNNNDIRSNAQNRDNNDIRSNAQNGDNSNVNSTSNNYNYESEDDSEYEYEEEYTFDVETGPGAGFDPLAFHRALGQYLGVEARGPWSGYCEPGDPDGVCFPPPPGASLTGHPGRVFAVIAALADPWTTPADTGPYDELLPSLATVCDVVAAVCLPMYTGEREFRLACDLAWIVGCCSEKLHCCDETGLQRAIGSTDWRETLQYWVPEATLASPVYQASDFHRLRLVYAVCVVCITAIGRLYAPARNPCLNPFLYLLLQAYKLCSKVILLGLQVDRQDEAQGFPGYPEPIREVVRGTSALRSAVALVLNEDYARRAHDFRHETLDHFLGPWGRRVGSSRLRCDNRVFASALLAMGTPLDHVGRLMKSFHTEDRYDEDIRYMFEMDFDSDPDDDYSRHHQPSLLAQALPKPPLAYGGAPRRAYGLDGVLRTYRIHPDCVCRLDGVGKTESAEMPGDLDPDPDDPRECSDYDFTDSIRMVIQDGDDGIEELLSDVIREGEEQNEEEQKDNVHEQNDNLHQPNTNVHEQNVNFHDDEEDNSHQQNPPHDKRKVVWAAIARNMDSNGNSNGNSNSHSPSKRFIISPVPRNIGFDSLFRDRRDIRRGQNNILTPAFQALLKSSAAGKSTFILPMHNILASLAALKSKTLPAKTCQHIISTVAFVVKYGEENLLMTNGQKEAWGNDDHLRPEYILSYICSFPGMISMISHNPSATFSIVDELLMVEGFRTSLLWFLANCEPNQWIFNYFHELLIGQRGNPRTSTDPRTSRYSFSRCGHIVLSETELRMVIKELLANVTGFVIRKLQDDQSHDRPAIQRLMKVVCLFLKSLDSKGIVTVNDSDWRLEVQTLLLQWINSGLVPEARELFFKSQRNDSRLRIVSEKEKVFYRQLRIVRQSCENGGPFKDALPQSGDSSLSRMRLLIEFAVRYILMRHDMLKGILARAAEDGLPIPPSRTALVCDALFGALYSVALDNELLKRVGTRAVLQLMAAANILSPDDLENPSVETFLKTKLSQMQAYCSDFLDDIARKNTM